MNNGKLGKPIYKPCPVCENDMITQWYWTYEDDPVERVLKAVECSHEVEPSDLGFESYEVWKNDESNFYKNKESENIQKTESELLELVPPSKRISRSSELV